MKLLLLLPLLTTATASFNATITSTKPGQNILSIYNTDYNRTTVYASFDWQNNTATLIENSELNIPNVKVSGIGHGESGVWFEYLTKFGRWEAVFDGCIAVLENGNGEVVSGGESWFGEVVGSGRGNMENDELKLARNIEDTDEEEGMLKCVVYENRLFKFHWDQGALSIDSYIFSIALVREHCISE
jgi:hypothetical protein